MATKACGCQGVRTCLVCDPVGAKTEQDQSGFGEGAVHLDLCEGCGCVVELHDFKTEEGARNKTCDGPNSHGDIGAFQQILKQEFQSVSVVRDFLTVGEETKLVVAIEASVWEPSQSGRRKQNYGPNVNYKKRKIKMKDYNGLPEYCRDLLEKVHAVDSLACFHPFHLGNIEYREESGSCIDPHKDDAWIFGERIVIISTLQDTCLWFSPEEDTSKSLGINSNTFVRVKLPRRSLLIMAGPVRYRWLHCIPRWELSSKVQDSNHPARRISVSFRELSPEFLSGTMSHVGQEIMNLVKSTWK